MTPRASRYSFGEFLLDTGREQLLRSGRDIPLTPKAFGTLRLLLDRYPNVVDKDTIAAEVWESAASDASMTMVMAELRKALGDSAAQPAFIRTVHKRGYAFCAPVSRDHAAPRDAPFYLVANGRRIALTDGEHALGRDPASSIAFDEPSVSWHHARIVVREGSLTVEDLGSTNGTFVNGTRVKAREVVKAGARIEMGTIVATIEAPTKGSRTVKIPGR